MHYDNLYCILYNLDDPENIGASPFECSPRRQYMSMPVGGPLYPDIAP
jgi:hypothetical protein